MALPGISINVSDGNLARNKDGFTHYTGLFVVSNSDASVTTAAYGSKAEMAAAISATASPLTYKFASSYFDKCPGGYLFVTNATASTDFSEIVTLGRFSGRQIRQFAVYDSATFSTSRISALGEAITTLDTEHAGVWSLYSSSNPGSYGSLADATLLNTPTVTPVFMRDTEGKPAIGQLAGVCAENNLAYSPANPMIGNLDTASILVDKLGDGTPLSSISDSTLSALAAKGWAVPRTHISFAGHYLAKSVTSTDSASDFFKIQHVRVINEVKRNAYTSLVPYIDAPITVTTQNKISEPDAAKLENAVHVRLDQMRTAGEISAFRVFVPRDQNVLSTGIVQVNIQVIPVGSAEFISVNIGFALTV